MKFSHFICCLTLTLVTGWASVSWAETRRPQPLLHKKVKGFQCTVAVSSQTDYVKQGRKSSENYSCRYRCFEDFNLDCVADNESCQKLVSVHWNARKYDLSGKGKGTFVGLDTSSVIAGAINRRSGALNYSLDEKHSFQGDPIFVKSLEASGSCRPDPQYVRPKKPASRGEEKPRRARHWND